MVKLLLDFIRNANVAAGEDGVNQKIGAYQAKTEPGTIAIDMDDTAFGSKS